MNIKFLTLLFLIGAPFIHAQDVHEEVFTQIYDTCIWGVNEDGEGFSGGGSLLENTLPYMEYLQEFMKRNHIKTVLDTGCGDWEFSKYMDWTGVEYTGYDVVKSVIDKNLERFSMSNIQFIHENFLSVDLPSADLLLCKHVLQHLSNQDILNFLEQLPRFKYCLITNQVDTQTLSGDNEDIAIGGCHKVDLSKAPFNVTGRKVLTYKIEEDSIHQVFLVDNSGNN